MDGELALRLIHPLTAGDEICDGWTLRAIDVRHDEEDYRRDSIHLVFSTEFRLIISHRSAARAAFRTKHFNISIRNSETVLTEPKRHVVSLLRERLETNDVEVPKGWKDILEEPTGPAADGAQLWLIPGHIGNPLDMSIRSLRVLKTVQLIFIEEGSLDAVEGIFQQFELGPLPQIIELTGDGKKLDEQLRSGIADGLTMALFGACEGVPGLCDPGWRLLATLHRIKSDVVVRTTSGGSALTTALMYMEQPSPQFWFLGLFKNESGDIPLFQQLERTRFPSQLPSLMCFASGDDLREEWGRLCRVCTGLNGRLTLFRNLTLANESVDRLNLSSLGRIGPEFLAPSDKIVLRIDLRIQLNPTHWMRRWLRRARITDKKG